MISGRVAPIGSKRATDPAWAIVAGRSSMLDVGGTDDEDAEDKVESPRPPGAVRGPLALLTRDRAPAPAPAISSDFSSATDTVCRVKAMSCDGCATPVCARKNCDARLTRCKSEHPARVESVAVSAASEMSAPDEEDDESENEDEDEDEDEDEAKTGCDADGIKAAELRAPASERAGAGAADAGRCEREAGR